MKHLNWNVVNNLNVFETQDNFCVCFVEFDWKHAQRKLDSNIIKMNINPVCTEDQSFK
jgi:hypothetical protein